MCGVMTDNTIYVTLWLSVKKYGKRHGQLVLEVYAISASTSISVGFDTSLPSSNSTFIFVLFQSLLGDAKLATQRASGIYPTLA